jgi:uncharacterized delta-60 repeat protein
VLRIASIALVLLAFVPAVAAGDGAPDPSFGQGGSLSIAPQRFSSASGVAVDGQGRTLVGAMLEDGSMLRTEAAVLRLLPDGSLDPAFGSGGVATITAPAPFRTLRAESMALDASGRIVFAGEVDESVPAVWRVLPDGTLDPAFGSGGIAIPREAYGGAPAWWEALAFDGSEIVVAGITDKGLLLGVDAGPTAVLARLDDNGVPDPSFAAAGFLELPVPGLTDPEGIAVDRTGRIVLGIGHATTKGFPNDRTAEVVRLNGSGALDTTFGDGGRAVLGSGGRASVRIRDDGAIVALGEWWHTPAQPQTPVIAAQLLPDGQLDRTFGKAGEVTAPSPFRFAGGALDCQGDLLIANAVAGVNRFGPDGRLDPTFRLTGFPRVAVGDTTAVAQLGYFAFAPTGAVLLGGIAVDGPSVVGGNSPVGHYSIALARLTAACPVVDSRPPAVTLTCTAGCRRVLGAALDDPVGRGVRRVLLGVQRISGTTCQVWNGRRFVPLACARAATRLVSVPLVGGAFRTPPLGRGRSIVRAVAIDGAGNRSRPQVLRINR